MSDNFYDRYDGVLGDSDPITRAVRLAFLACPIYRGLLDGLIEKDVVFPFAFLLFRPFITHNMATAILTKKGAETGETLIGHADFQLGDDVARKMHYGHYTMYLKSIVYRQDNVFLAQNVYCQNYVNGNDTTFMGWHNLVNDNAPKGSIYSILQPFGAPETPSGEPFVPCSELPNPLDISGRHNTSAPHLVQLDDANGTNGTTPTAATTATCGAGRTTRWTCLTLRAGCMAASTSTTRWFQGHQGMFNPATSNYDNIVPVLAPILHFETDVVWRLSYTISPLAVPVPVCLSGAGGYAGAGTVNYTGPYTGFDQCNGCPTPCSHWWCSGYFLNGAVYNGPCGPNTFGDIDRPPSFFSPPPPALPGYVNPRTTCAWNAAAPLRFLPFNVEVYALGSTTGPDLTRVQQAMVTGRWLIHGYMETRNLVYNVTTPSGGGSPTLSVSKAFFSVHNVPEGQPFTPLPLITGLSLHTTLGASLGGTLYNYNPPQPNDTPVHAACFGMLQVNITLVGIDALPS